MWRSTPGRFRQWTISAPRQPPPHRHEIWKSHRPTTVSQHDGKTEMAASWFWRSLSPPRAFFTRRCCAGLAGLLIVDQPTDDYDCVCISSWGYDPNGDRCYDVAADLYRRKPSCRVLLVAPDLEPAGADRRHAFVRVDEPAGVARPARAARGRLGPPRRALERLGHRPSAGRLDAAITPATACSCSASNSIAGRCAARWMPCSNPTPPHRCASARCPTAIATTRTGGLAACGYRAFAESWLLRLQSRPDGGDAAKTPEKNADDYERDFLHALPESTP